MTVSEINVSFAGKELLLGFQFKGTEDYFIPYSILPEHSSGDIEPISADRKEIEKRVSETGCSYEYAEYTGLELVVGNELAHWERILFHGAAFIHGGGAYILTAPSGTGKSTQYRNLRMLFGHDYRIINGDKPVLALDEKGSIWVYPSPWNGKEGWHSASCAPLKGIVILSQGGYNAVSRPGKEESILRLMEEVLFTAQDKTSVQTVCRFIDIMIKRVPIYRFVNKGDAESSRMLDSLFHSLEQDAHEV
jgi:hypothetical protein